MLELAAVLLGLMATAVATLALALRHQRKLELIRGQLRLDLQVQTDRALQIAAPAPTTPQELAAGELLWPPGEFRRPWEEELHLARSGQRDLRLGSVDHTGKFTPDPAMAGESADAWRSILTMLRRQDRPVVAAAIDRWLEMRCASHAKAYVTDTKSWACVECEILPRVHGDQP